MKKLIYIFLFIPLLAFQCDGEVEPAQSENDILKITISPENEEIKLYDTLKLSAFVSSRVFRFEQQDSTVNTNAQSYEVSFHIFRLKRGDREPKSDHAAAFFNYENSIGSIIIPKSNTHPSSTIVNAYTRFLRPVLSADSSQYILNVKLFPQEEGDYFIFCSNNGTIIQNDYHEDILKNYGTDLNLIEIETHRGRAWVQIKGKYFFRIRK